MAAPKILAALCGLIAPVGVVQGPHGRQLLTDRRIILSLSKRQSPHSILF